jgi:acyl-CoA hydrolase
MANDPSPTPIRLIDMIFPGDANHHGTLFGGVALAHMDKVAFLAASRHARAPVVTASSEKIDFSAPARIGEMVEASARIVRVGRSSLEVAVELSAEDPVHGEPRLCTSGRFVMVAVKGPQTRLPLPAIRDSELSVTEIGVLQMVDMVFPPQTNHYGTLYGGDALKMMGKAAFIAATKHSRAVMVMAASELSAKVQMVGRSSVRVSVALWAEHLVSGERRHAATALFTMVAVDSNGRPKAFSTERSAGG